MTRAEVVQVVAVALANGGSIDDEIGAAEAVADALFACAEDQPSSLPARYRYTLGHQLMGAAIASFLCNAKPAVWATLWLVGLALTVTAKGVG